MSPRKMPAGRPAGKDGGERSVRRDSAQAMKIRRAIIPQLFALEGFIAQILTAIDKITVQVAGVRVPVPGAISVIEGAAEAVAGVVGGVAVLEKALEQKFASVLFTGAIAALRMVGDGADTECKEAFTRLEALREFAAGELLRRARMAGTTSTDALRAELLRLCRGWRREIIEGRQRAKDAAPAHGLPTIEQLEGLTLVELHDAEVGLHGLADEASRLAPKPARKEKKGPKTDIRVGDQVTVVRGMFVGKSGPVVALVVKNGGEVTITVGKTKVTVLLADVTKA